MSGYRWESAERIVTVTLDRPERKNALTFASYAELRDRFRALAEDHEARAVVLHGAGDDFCSGGDVKEIIGPLTRMTSSELLAFTTMTGDLVQAMRSCPQPIVAAIDGACAGAGAALAMASDVRYGTARSSVAFLFVRVGLAGCDMGACALLPRIIGLGRAAELLFTGRAMSGEEAHRWGFYNALLEPPNLIESATVFARAIAGGPTRAHAATKRMLNEELAMPLEDAIRAEALAQARLMESADFRRAYEAFTQRQTPAFQGD